MTLIAEHEASGDLVWEVAEIAKVIGRNPRQTYHMLSTGKLPAKQIGNRWVGSRRKLLSALTGDDAP